MSRSSGNNTKRNNAGIKCLRYALLHFIAQNRHAAISRPSPPASHIPRPLIVSRIFHAVHQAQPLQGGVADLYVIIVLRAVVGRAEMYLERAGGFQLRTVVRAGERTVQQMNTVEIRGAGYALDFRGHLLKLAVDHQTLGGVIGAGGRLFRQLLHANQLLVDDTQRPVRRLNQGDGVVDVARALMEGSHIRPHQLPDGQTRRIVRRTFHAQSGGQTTHGGGQLIVVSLEMKACIDGEKIVSDGGGHGRTLAKDVTGR